MNRQLPLVRFRSVRFCDHWMAWCFRLVPTTLDLQHARVLHFENRSISLHTLRSSLSISLLCYEPALASLSNTYRRNHHHHQLHRDHLSSSSWAVVIKWRLFFLPTSVLSNSASAWHADRPDRRVPNDLVLFLLFQCRPSSYSHRPTDIPSVAWWPLFKVTISLFRQLSLVFQSVHFVSLRFQRCLFAFHPISISWVTLFHLKCLDQIGRSDHICPSSCTSF